MEISVNRLLFLEAINLVGRAINPVNPKMILTGAKVQVQEDGVVLLATDDSLTIQTKMIPDEKNKLQIADTGSIVINTHIFSELLRRMSSEMIQIVSTDDDLLRVSGTDGNYDLICQSAYKYPPVALDRPEKHFVITSRFLKAIERHVVYAASEKNSRQVLLGVNVEMNGEHFTATATDSYRMASFKADYVSDETAKITITSNFAKEIAKCVPEDKDVDLYCDRRRVMVTYDNTLVQSPLLEGTFPDVYSIIPVNPEAQLKIKASDLIGMLNRSMIYTSKKSSLGSVVPVEMSCSAEGVSMRVLSSQIGSCRQVFENVEYTGKEFTFAFNAQLMLQALQALDAQDQVELFITNELRPIRISRPDDASLTMVVVPIRQY